MSQLDDLPKRDLRHRIEEQSKTAFRTAITECGEFVIQSEDDHDYGTDLVIEAVDDAVMTNVRVHVQLKGTGCEPHGDASISVSIRRRNLNYLVPVRKLLRRCHYWRNGDGEMGNRVEWGRASGYL